MRKSAYLASAAAMVLTLATVSCSDNADSKATPNPIAGEPAPIESKTDSAGAHATPMAAYIRYVDTQKILSSYTLAREVAKADSAAQIQLASYHQQLTSRIERRGQEIQEKMQRNGYLSEASYNADVAQLQREQQTAENSFAQRQRDYATDLMAKQQQLNDSVKSVIDFLSLKYNLDAVIDKSAGLYFNPTLDITDEVLNELNRRYTPAQ